MGRRKAGEGTWGSKKIGKYTYQYYRSADQEYTYGKTVKEVKEKLKQKEKDKASVSDKTIFGDYLKWYVNTILSPKVEPTTLLTYNRICNSLIEFEPEEKEQQKHNIIDMQLCSLTPNMPYMQNYLNMLATKYSRNYISKAWSLIAASINYGAKNGKFNKNILDGVKIPKESQVASKKKEIPFLPLSEVEKLYKEMNSNYKCGSPKYDMHARVLMLFINTGLRLGEMRALRWNDIITKDNGNKFLRVDESYAEIKYRGENKKIVIKDPKNESSRREIPLNKRALEMLDYLESIHPDHKDNDFICRTKTGKIVSQQHLHRTLERMLKGIGYPNEPKVSVHALRHTFGSLLYDKGVDLKTISLLLGHNSIRTTEMIYVDVTKDKMINAVNVLDD